jgi:hypothetical protein
MIGTREHVTISSSLKGSLSALTDFPRRRERGYSTSYIAEPKAQGAIKLQPAVSVGPEAPLT